MGKVIVEELMFLTQSRTAVENSSSSNTDTSVASGRSKSVFHHVALMPTNPNAFTFGLPSIQGLE